jgi:hypothetical protein
LAAQGVAPDWDIRVVLQEVAAHAERLLPEVEGLKVRSWIERGASETYLTQVRTLRDQVRSVVQQSKDLAARPEKLSAAIEVYFRLAAVDSLVRSLGDGVRRYEGDEAAGRLTAVARENSANRERFEQYILEMAVQREQECAAMDHEAQRCRGSLARQPVETKSPGRKK